MSIPRPTRGMMVELHGGHKDGQRIKYAGHHRIRVPVIPPVRYVLDEAMIPNGGTFIVEAYTLRQSQPDGHWFYVLEGQ